MEMRRRGRRAMRGDFVAVFWARTAAPRLRNLSAEDARACVARGSLIATVYAQYAHTPSRIRDGVGFGRRVRRPPFNA
eukprot:9199606-Lingulodinium_polyedra.AAC.1